MMIFLSTSGKIRLKQPDRSWWLRRQYNQRHSGERI